MRMGEDIPRSTRISIPAEALTTCWKRLLRCWPKRQSQESSFLVSGFQWGGLLAALFHLPRTNRGNQFDYESQELTWSVAATPRLFEVSIGWDVARCNEQSGTYPGL